MIFTKSYYPSYKIGSHTYGQITIHGNGIVDQQNYVEIGDYCSFAPGLQLQLGGNHNMTSVSTYPFENGKKSFDKKYGIYIGNDVWTGLNVLIRHGVTIGHGAVIGMGSVVLNDVPDYAVVAGVPAKLIRYRFSKDIINKLLLIKWWNWPYETVLERINDDVETFVSKWSRSE